MIPVIGNSTTKEIDEKDVHYFGTEVKRKYTKAGMFSRFISQSYVKDYKGNLYYTDLTISKLKKYFNNYDPHKKKIMELKNGKKRFATEWMCEVISIEKAKKLRPDQIKLIHNAIQKNSSFLVNAHYLHYRIYDNFFKDSKNDTIVYADLDKNLLIPVNIEGKHTKAKYEEWKINYLSDN